LQRIDANGDDRFHQPLDESPAASCALLQKAHNSYNGWSEMATSAAHYGQRDPRRLQDVGVESTRRLVLMPLLHATSMHERRDKPSDGCAEKSENAKRKKQKG